MKVIATKRGYLGKLREPGDEFEVPEGSKASWFQPVDKPADKKGKKSAETSVDEMPTGLV